MQANIVGMWSEDERRPALELIKAGVCDREVARRTGISRSTVGYWRRNPSRHQRFGVGDPSWRPPHPGMSLPHAFPQCGPGRKHDRQIVLADWQLELSRAQPERLIRGLLHADGCRSVNRFSTKLPSGRVATYAYPRYFFSNLSADIRRIFCDHCDLLGIRWTMSNPRNVSIANRDSVALLDAFVGPKS